MKTIKILTTLAFFINVTLWTAVAVLYTCVVDPHFSTLANSMDRAASSHYVSDRTSDYVGATDRVVAPVSPKPTVAISGPVLRVTAGVVAPVAKQRTARTARANDDTHADADACENGLGAPGCPKDASDRVGTVLRVTNGVITHVSHEPTAPTASANAYTNADACENGLGAPGCPKDASDRVGTMVHLN